MLIEFKVANYRSIREEQTLSFVASNYSDELPQNLIPIDLPGLKKGTQLVKAVAIYGANASGKSNLVGALRYMAEFVRDSATKGKPNHPINVSSHRLHGERYMTPTTFEITFVLGGTRMVYGLGVDFMRVRHEYLVAYPKGRPQVWFERDWVEESKTYAWSESTSHFRHDEALRGAVRANAAFLATAAQFNHELATKVWSWISNGLLFLNLAHEKPESKLALELLSTERGKNLLTRWMSSVDLGIAEIGTVVSGNGLLQRFQKIQQEKPKQSDAYEAALAKALDDPPSGDEEFEPSLKHRGHNGGLYTLDFDSSESTGTRQYFYLLGYWASSLTNGTPLVIDEIEASLHPLLVSSLLRVFLSTASDKTAPQLIFTTHNPLLLDQTLLRRDQIWFTEKDDEGATKLYPLTDYAPRKNESLVKGYLAGRYGGIPFIPENLGFDEPSESVDGQDADTRTKQVGAKRQPVKTRKPAKSPNAVTKP